MGTWDVEGGSINIMSRQGWTRASYKAGDPVRLVGHPMKDGSKGISLFYAIKPDGTRLYHDIARPADDKKVSVFRACRRARSPTGSSGRIQFGPIRSS